MMTIEKKFCADQFIYCITIGCTKWYGANGYLLDHILTVNENNSETCFESTRITTGIHVHIKVSVSTFMVLTTLIHLLHI